MCLPTGRAHGGDLVVECRPVLGQHLRAVDHDIDFVGTHVHCIADFCEALRKGREARGEAGGDGGDGDIGAFQRLHRGGHHGGINADGTDGGHGGEAEAGDDVIAQRALRLGAEAVDAARRVVTRQGREVDALEGLHKPCGLVVLLDRAACGEARGAALRGGEVHLHVLEPVEGQGCSGVARDGGEAGRSADRAKFVHIHKLSQTVLLPS